MLVDIIDRKGWKYAKISGAGRCVFKSLRTQDPAEARRIVKEGEFERLALANKADAMGRELWNRLFTGKNVRVRDTLEPYEAYRHVAGHAARTILEDRQILEKFFMHAGWIANDPIAVVTEKMVFAFVNREARAGFMKRKRWLSCIRTWLEYCVQKHWIVGNHAVDVHVRTDILKPEQLITTPYRPITDDEVAKILAGIPKTDFWHGAVLFAYHHGLRLQAIAKLEDFNVTGNELRVYAQKNKREVKARLHDDVIAWLEVWRTVRPASDLPFLFPAQAAAPHNTLSSQFARILERIGVQGCVFHGLRKSAADRKWNEALAELKTPERQALAKLIAERGLRGVQQALGHAPGSPVTERHYLGK